MSVFNKFLDAIRVNDDFEDDDLLEDDDFLEDDDDEFEDEKPRKRFFKKLMENHKAAKEEAEESYSSRRTFENQTGSAKEAKTAKSTKSYSQASSASKITPIRSPKKTTTAMEVCVIKPNNMEDTREITETLIAGCTVILNLEGLDMELAQRIIDFTSGSCYAVNGGLQNVSSYIFILTPENVDITGDYDQILSGNFDLPTMRNEY